MKETFWPGNYSNAERERETENSTLPISFINTKKRRYLSDPYSIYLRLMNENINNLKGN